MTPAQSNDAPLISVIILNYNGAPWLERCLSSLRDQTIFEQLEIIVADNASPDKSDRLAEELMRGWANGRVIQNGANLGYCEGNNRAAAGARGQYLFFLNNDTWMEKDCLENLVAETRRLGAHASAPSILAYDGAAPDTPICWGFDMFGLPTYRWPGPESGTVFIAGGCSYLIERTLFQSLGGFDSQLYMYADEADLSWRVWISGHKIITAVPARLHHRGAANVNPQGGRSTVELRTSDIKRFYANRNCLLVQLKSAQHILMLTLPMQLSLYILEAIVMLVIVRRWSYIKAAYLDAFKACWQMRHHVISQRRLIRSFRRRSDWWMLRFFRIVPGRFEELRLVRRFGAPIIAPAKPKA